MSAHSPPRIALALAGGGPLGAIYEIGALCALQDSLRGLHLTGLQHYVGVSAGGFIAAALANGISAHQLVALFIEDPRDGGEAFDPALLMQPAWGECWQRWARLAPLGAAQLWSGLRGQWHPLRALERLAPAVPTGLLSNAPIAQQLATLFNRPGRTDDFRQLRTRLSLVATHLDSAGAVAFGQPPFDHVPISKAVQASAALPGLFPPVEIDGAHYVDGALVKTLHASIALDAGVDLLLCVNPLVPFDATAPQSAHQRLTPWGAAQRIPRIAQGGLPAVLSQTFRSLIHSRLMLGMKHYAQAYPQTDILLIEPDRRDPELYLANTFSYRQRRELAEHAYQSTRALLRAQRAALGRKLAFHGITLDAAALDDPTRCLCLPSPLAAHGVGALGVALGRLHTSLDSLGQLVQPLQASPDRPSAPS